MDYIGIFDDVATALTFDERAVQQVVSNIDELRKSLAGQIQKCLAFFAGVDRSIGGYEGLMAAKSVCRTTRSATSLLPSIPFLELYGRRYRGPSAHTL